MMASAKNRIRQAGRPARRVAVAVAVAGVVLAGNAAISVAGADNGRDGTTVPGAPSDAPAPAPSDLDRGSDTNVAPPLGRSATPAAPSLPATDNGRGGDDPAFGPLAIPVERAAAPAAQAGYDTDSGAAPVPAAAGSDASRAAPDAPVDQDVPGSRSPQIAGTDEPSNDADG
jgi:hypothetical protein